MEDVPTLVRTVSDGANGGGTEKSGGGTLTADDPECNDINGCAVTTVAFPDCGCKFCNALLLPGKVFSALLVEAEESG